MYLGLEANQAYSGCGAHECNGIATWDDGTLLEHAQWMPDEGVTLGASAGAQCFLTELRINGFLIHFVPLSTLLLVKCPVHLN